jgi:aspartyl-tRNA(Asn)/glutamyl-tRNA(Gln) amidotransferase subunit C
MMKLSIEQVRHIAELAKLGLTPEEIERYRGQLSAILDYADALQQLDVADVEPMSHAIALTNVMRADAPADSYSREEILANAPDEQDGQIRVRAILE